MYGLDLGPALFAGPGVRLRRLLNLVFHLPGDSAIFRRLDIADATTWTTTDELLAVLVETLDVHARDFRHVHQKKGRPYPRPLVEVSRPGRTSEDRPKPVPMSDPSARRFFGGAVHYTPPESDGDDPPPN